MSDDKKQPVMPPNVTITPNKIESIVKAKKRSRKIIGNEDIVSILVELGYHFRKNEVTGLDEVNETPITDDLMKRIHGEISEYGEKHKIWQLLNKNRVRSGIAHTLIENTFNPFTVYINSCLDKRLKTSAGSRETPFIDRLCEAFIYVDKSEEYRQFSNIYIKKFLAGMIIKMQNSFEDSNSFKFQNPILVLKGRQGIGKSSFTRMLCRNIGMNYYEAGIIDPYSKDHVIKQSKKALWEVEELDATTGKSEANALKTFFTKDYISERPPYKEYVEHFVSRCSFIGTVNSNDFLKDHTGNRRFIVLDIESIDFKYIDSCDPDLILADAWHFADNCPKYRWPELTENEAQERDRRNERVRDKTLIEHVLSEHVEHFEGAFLRSEELINFLKGGNWNEIMPHDNQMAKQIKIAMEAMQFKYFKKTISRGYVNCRWKNGIPPKSIK